jgi:hypothetical protein
MRVLATRLPRTQARGSPPPATATTHAPCTYSPLTLRGTVRTTQDSQQYLSTGRPVQKEDYLLWGRLIQEAMRPAQETLQSAATAGPPPSEDVLSDARVLLQDLQMAASSLESVKVRAGCGMSADVTPFQYFVQGWWFRNLATM